MKILHVCLSGIVTDGYSYQDNLLPKYHKRLGNDVTLVTSQFVYNNEGQIVKSTQTQYVNADGVKIIRLPTQCKQVTYKERFNRFVGITNVLKKVDPDILFIHGVQFMEVPEIVKYLKCHPSVVVYVDNHADSSNSGRNWLSRYLLHGIFWKHMAQLIQPYVKMFYGVLPARVDWLIEVYGLPREKCELLVMGADDDQVTRVGNDKIRERTRNRLNISDKDFFIITGGKIDQDKIQTLTLMKAVHAIKNSPVRLAVFGPVVPELREKFENLCDGKEVQYLGFATMSDAYEYFSAADLAVFPGRHSVYWEEAAGTGVPLLCKLWPGTSHINLGGNAKFLRTDSIDEIKKNIEKLVLNATEYEHMKEVAVNKGIPYFSYMQIAKRSLS